ncbi:MAG: TIGR02281 family clan AA aspartic protease [Pseudoruegeria sp.]
MSPDQIARLSYLVLLGAALLMWFIAQNRQSKSKVFQQAMIWGLIFVGMIAAYGLWGDIRGDILPRQTYLAEDASIEVPKSPDGHYYLVLDVNDTPVRFVVDTGATEIVLTQKDAERVGLDTAALAYLGSANTANGIVRTARVSLEEVALEAIRDRNVAAYVNQGTMHESLLGMRYLSRYEALEIRDNTLILKR